MSIQLAPGPRNVELGYAEITSNFTQTGAGSSDVTGLSVTVNVGARPILVILGASAFYNSSASGVGGLTIKEGSTSLGALTASLTTLVLPVFRQVRLNPSAGSHTYKVVISQLITGNTILTGSATDPASLHVIEI